MTESSGNTFVSVEEFVTQRGNAETDAHSHVLSRASSFKYESDAIDDDELLDGMVDTSTPALYTSFDNITDAASTPIPHRTPGGLIDAISPRARHSGDTAAFLWDFKENDSGGLQGEDASKHESLNAGYSEPLSEVGFGESGADGDNSVDARHGYADSDAAYGDTSAATGYGDNSANADYGEEEDRGSVSDPDATTKDYCLDLGRDSRNAESVESVSETKTDSDGETAEFVKKSGGVTCTRVPNPFAEDMEEDSSVVLFGRNGPVLAEESAALANIASSPLTAEARVVEKLVFSILFQRREITNLKNIEVELADRCTKAERRRHSEVERRRSFAMHALIGEVDRERSRAKELENENADLRARLDREQAVTDGVLQYCKNVDPSIDFSRGVNVALDSLRAGMVVARRQSESRVQEQAIELEEYAERLLDLERVVAETQRRHDILLDENTELKLRLLPDHQQNPDTPVSVEASPSATSSQQSLGQRSSASANEVRMMEKQLSSFRTEIETLRFLIEKCRQDKEKVDDALLHLNVEQEAARSKIESLRTERASSEARLVRVNEEWAADKSKYLEMSRELTQNIVDAVSDLQNAEATIQQLRTDVADREAALIDLQGAEETAGRLRADVADREAALAAQRDISVRLEEQLNRITSESIAKSRHVVSRTDGAEASQSAIGDVVTSLQTELRNAESLLLTRSASLERMKSEMYVLSQAVSSLEEERSQCQDAAISSTRFNSANNRGAEDGRKVSSAVRSLTTDGVCKGCASGMHEGEQFLRRLSAKLGCHAESNHELIAKLVKRVEDLMKERSRFEQANEKLHREVVTRERGLHGLRSEMQSEISTLKAEVAHLENVRDRAVSEREAAETRILDMADLNQTQGEDFLADLTASSFGANRFSQGGTDLDSQGLLTGCDAFGQGFVDEDGVHWEDPSIQAAVQSVSALVGSKDSLAARNRALLDKLRTLLGKGRPGAGANAGSYEEFENESRTLLETLTGIVAQQQSIIHRMRGTSASSSAAGTPRKSRAAHGDGNRSRLSKSLASDFCTEDDTDDSTQRTSDVVVVNKTFSRAQRSATTRNDSEIPLTSRNSMSQAASFLRDQLAESRTLYAEKLNANAQLCGLVKELQQEMNHMVEERKDMEGMFSSVTKTHEEWLVRVSQIAGVDSSMVSVEDFLRSAVVKIATLHSELVQAQMQQTAMRSRLTGALGQKRVLAHIIHLYQSKYQLDILALPSQNNPRSPKERVRRAMLAFVAGSRLAKLASAAAAEQALSPARLSLSSVFVNISASFDLPALASIAAVRQPGIELMSASVALAAVPRLEASLASHESEIADLRSTLAALNSSAATARPGIGIDGAGSASAFDYDQDVLDRKNDLSRRLRKVLKQKEELEARFAREKQQRTSAEARATRYVDKTNALRQKLKVANTTASSRERTYKAAIRYLKSKADHAVGDDAGLCDENTDPGGNYELPVSELAPDTVPNAGGLKARSAKAVGLLEGQIRAAEQDLARLVQGSSEYEQLSSYIAGLRKAARRLRRNGASKSQTTPNSRLASPTGLGQQ